MADRQPSGIQPKLTSQQDAAIHTRDVSVGLSAGAGCGKTFVLTQRFLAYLEPQSANQSDVEPPTAKGSSALNPQPLALGHLVAITFTERAAREMRDRIRAECRRRLKECPDEQVAHWQSLLREIDGARISTIHAFCAGLLRSHAVEAGLDPRFELLDEATSTSFLRASVAASVRELLAARNPDAMELVLEFGLDGTEDLVRSLIGQRFRIDFAAWESMTPSVLAQQWLIRWRTRTVPDQLARLWDSSSARSVVRLLSAHEPNHKLMLERRAIVLDLLGHKPDATDPAALLQRLRDNAQVVRTGNDKAWSSTEVYESIKSAFEELRDEIGKVAKSLDVTPDDAQTAAVLGLMALRVTRHAADEYAREKHRAGRLDFDDLLLLTRDLLRNHPHVRQRLANGISLLMVDEFQDTDPVQSEIVRHLCGDGLTNGRLFFVGDAKQSIYRFRRADPAVFDALRSELDERGRLPLSRNFRSQPAILQFVNALFDDAMETAYEPLVAHHEQLATVEPTIEFLFASDPPLAPLGRGAGGEGPSEHTEAPRPRSEMRGPSLTPDPSPQGGEGNKPNVEDVRRCEADWIASRIQQMLTDGVPRVRDRAADVSRGNEGSESPAPHPQPLSPSEGEGRAIGAGLRPAEPGDVVILFRALTDVRHYEAALREHDLPYYLVGGRAFFAQQEIFDLINLCRYLLDHDDEVSLVGLLRSPFFGLSDDSLLALAERGAGSLAPHPQPLSPLGGEGRSIRAALDAPPANLPEEQRDRMVHATRVLAELERARHRLPVTGLLNLALDRTGYDAALLLEFLGRRKLANLRKLIEMAREFDRSGLFGLSEFVEWLKDATDDEAKEELAAIHPESSNVIRLMTIHQSKGLEFPIVVVADMDRKLNSGSQRIRFDPELGPLVNPPEKFGRDVANIGRKMFDLAERDAEEAESRRLLYVATTRAADHLILSAGLKDIDKLNSPWMKLLASRFDLRTAQPVVDDATGEPAIPARSLADVPAIRVHTSKPEPPRAAAAAKSARLPLDRFREAVTQAEPIPLPRLLEPLRSEASASRLFSVSELEVVDTGAFDLAGVDWGLAALDPSHPGAETESDADVNREQLGTLVHAVLERLDLGKGFRSWEDLGSLITARWDTNRGELSPATRQAAELMIGTFLRSPLAAEVARSRRCFRELDFVLRWPPPAGSRPAHLISGSIDCTYQTDQGGWAILDYKTGALRSSLDAEAWLRKFSFQLGVYCLAFEQWLGKIPERMELIGLRGVVSRLWLRPTDRFRDETISRLEAAISRMVESGDAGNLTRSAGTSKVVGTLRVP